VSDIFISYASGDRNRVKPLVDALQQQGWTVWWDRTIRPGEIFDRVIEAAIKDSRCAIVLWSHQSVESDWVRNEAHEANRRKILVPALIDEVRIPLAFGTMQYANLIGWAGDLPSVQFDELAQAVRVVLGSSAPASPQTVTPSSQAAAASPAITPEPPSKTPKEGARKPQPDSKAAEEKAAEKARLEKERKAAAAEKARLEKEERERQAAAEKARLEREGRKQQAPEEKARAEREEQKRQAAAEKARAEREEQKRQAAEEKARAEREERRRQALAERARAQRGRQAAAERAGTKTARLEDEPRERAAAEAVTQKRVEAAQREGKALPVRLLSLAGWASFVISLILIGFSSSYDSSAGHWGVFLFLAGPALLLLASLIGKMWPKR
jgi:TIR domain